MAIEAIKEQKTISEIAVEYKVSPSLISAWKAEFLENASQAFMKTGNQSREADKLKHEKEKLLKKVGQLKLEVDFFALKYPLEISVMREEWNTEEKMKRGRNLPAGISLNRYCKLADTCSDGD